MFVLIFVPRHVVNTHTRTRLTWKREKRQGIKACLCRVYCPPCWISADTEQSKHQHSHTAIHTLAAIYNTDLNFLTKRIIKRSEIHQHDKDISKKLIENDQNIKGKLCVFNNGKSHSSAFWMGHLFRGRWRRKSHKETLEILYAMERKIEKWC